MAILIPAFYPRYDFRKNLVVLFASANSCGNALSRGRVGWKAGCKELV